MLKQANFPHSLACHLQIDVDQDPAYHFDPDPVPDPAYHLDVDSDPDPTFQVDADSDTATILKQVRNFFVT